MSAPVTSPRFMTTVELDGRLTDTQRHDAARYVAANSRDTDDARLLLQALGLIDSERDVTGSRTAFGAVRSKASRR